MQHRRRSARAAATVAAGLAVATVLATVLSGAETRPSAADSTAAAANIATAKANTGAAGASTASAGASTTAADVDAAHPYGDPTWFPLRTSSRVRCVLNNCTNPVRHGYWAIDFIGERGDPIHPAGSGVFHVGDVSDSCGSPPNAGRGNWAWVDHGGGVVTRYHHLASAVAEEGDLVTPRTRIATLGNTGSCKSDYLHFEVRHRGVRGDRVDPGPLSACTDDGEVSFPADLPDGNGAASWNEVVVQRQRVPTGDTTSDCVSVGPTPDRPDAVSGRRANHAAHLSWPRPGPGVDRVTLSKQDFHPSAGNYFAPTYRTLPRTSTQASYAGLRNGRPYRFRVGLHNDNGHSDWSQAVEVTPAGPPATPQLRWLRSDRSRVYFGWTKSRPDGTPVTGYVASLRCRVGDVWKPWQRVDLPWSSLHYRWENRSPGRVCQATVQAKSTAGRSSHLPRRSVLVRR